MVTPKPFIRPATAARIQHLRRRGAATTQLLQDPTSTVTFLGRNDLDGDRFTLTVAPDVALIRIRLDARQPNEPIVNQGATEARVTGTFRAWAEDVALVDKGHRFTWDGQDCVVTIVEPDRNGQRVGHFELLQGRR